MTVALAVGSTPLRAVRRLEPHFSEEKTHNSQGCRTSLDVVAVAQPPLAKRLRLSLPSKRAETEELPSEVWEETTTEPESAEGTPKSSVADDETTSAAVLSPASVLSCDSDSEAEERGPGAVSASASGGVIAVAQAKREEAADDVRPSFATSLLACARARELVRGAVSSARAYAAAAAAASGNRRELPDEVALQAQVLACYFVQASFAAEGSLELRSEQELEVIVGAAAHVAMEVSGAFDFLSGADVVGEASAKLGEAIRENLSGVPECLPLDYLEEVVDDLVQRLPFSEAFRKGCGRHDPSSLARSLAATLLQVAGCFVADGVMSAAVVLEMEPEVAAAAAVALATGLVLRRMGIQVSSEELLALLETDDCDIQLMKESVAVFSDVFRVWRQWQAKVSEEKRPAPATPQKRKLATAV